MYSKLTSDLPINIITLDLAEQKYENMAQH